MQLPLQSSEATARAMAAALREALTEKLGVQAEEIVPAAGKSLGLAGETLYSVFLYDKAAGGAGLSARMGDLELFNAVLNRSAQLLDCPEACIRGCPACILRPDLNVRDIQFDRKSAFALATGLAQKVQLPTELKIFGQETQLAGQSASAIILQNLRLGNLQAVDLWFHGDPTDWQMSSWPMRKVLLRLNEAGIRPRIGLTAVALTSAGMHMDRKLALHALAQQADLQVVDTLPYQNKYPILAHLYTKNMVGIVAVDNAETQIDDNWGQGAKAPILVGPSQMEANGKSVSASKLVELGAGNAKLMWPKNALDGSASSFGKRFWDFLSTNAPLEIGPLKSVGVRCIQYGDRYLLQPYTLSLLSQIIRYTPRAKEASIRIQTAYDDRLTMDARFLHHSFKSDAMRQQVLEQIFPTAIISIRPKSELPHFRKLHIELLDGRQIEIFLEQGMGSWRIDGSERHDFDASAQAQAKILEKCLFEIKSEGTSVPIALTVN